LGGLFFPVFVKVKMKLVVFTGLPGAGKSSVAEPVGRELGIPVFAKDWLEAALKRVGLGQDEKSAGIMGHAGYELLTVLAQHQLNLGQSAILDSVAGFEDTRQQWRNLAATHRADWYVIECICSDEMLHRKRLTTRRRGSPGWGELTWAEVERVKTYYHPWSEEHLVLDATNPLAENIQAALAYVSHG
jgi:predicted kinase